MKFRKKPVVIEAHCFSGKMDSAREILIWMGGDGGSYYQPEEEALFIETLEGVMRADPGDWIIKGVKGEFYPCKADIFVATYEPA